jgi:hypothetical protein
VIDTSDRFVVLTEVAPPAQRERRACPRRPAGREVALRRVPGRGHLLWACTLNVCRGGVCLLLSTFFPLGTILALRLPGTGRLAARPVLARVVRAVRARHGNAILGCAFEGGLPDEALDCLRVPEPPDPEGH